MDTWTQLRLFVYRPEATAARPFCRAVEPHAIRARRRALAVARMTIGEQLRLHRGIVMVVHAKPDEAHMLRVMFCPVGRRTRIGDEWAARILAEDNARARARVASERQAEAERAELRRIAEAASRCADDLLMTMLGVGAA